jgi:hypothetical protein
MNGIEIKSITREQNPVIVLSNINHNDPIIAINNSSDGNSSFFIDGLKTIITSYTCILISILILYYHIDFTIISDESTNDIFLLISITIFTYSRLTIKSSV